jgi:hypothetical protein
MRNKELFGIYYFEEIVGCIKSGKSDECIMGSKNGQDN